MSKQRHKSKLKISLFCGGRGSASIIRELMRTSDVSLRLLVNAYDDGLSTGALREFIPGMLGPSDFRKNMTYLLELYSNEQFALLNFLEYRLPLNFTLDDAENFANYLKDPAFVKAPREPLPKLFADLGPALELNLKFYLKTFFEFYKNKQQSFSFTDCSLGNLVFAGAYLKNNSNFNAATNELAKAFGSKASLINVSRGENRILVAIKENGEVLSREVEIVSPQSAAKISELFLLSTPLTSGQLHDLKDLSFSEKKSYLSNLNCPVQLSVEAREAIIDSDIIIYGSGTQFSSMIPSYKTDGILEAVQKSNAKVKLLLVNIEKDHDIQSLTAMDLIDSVLYHLGDSENKHGVITDALIHSKPLRPEKAVGMDWEKLSVDVGSSNLTYKKVNLVQADLENPVKAGIHSGFKSVQAINRVYEQRFGRANNEVDVFIDLNQRSIALEQILQEFTELEWKSQFSKIRLILNRIELPANQPSMLGEFLEIQTAKIDELFPEVVFFNQWVKEARSRYLVTITGDGEYRLRDVFRGIEILKGDSFGAVFGSRTQSRRQFLNSIDAAYGESRLLSRISWLGAYLFTFIFGLRFRIVFSDPFTGFRIFNRTALVDHGVSESLPHSSAPASRITKTLVTNSIEIAEYPVRYRTFKGFTNVTWRLKRGFRNAIGLFS